MTYLPQDFARCSSNVSKKECLSCLRNINISPVNPETIRQVWVGRWVLDTPCVSRVTAKESS